MSEPKPAETLEQVFKRSAGEYPFLEPDAPSVDSECAHRVYSTLAHGKEHHANSKLERRIQLACPFDDSERTQTSQTKTRVRLKSPRLQLQVTLQRMEKLAQSNTLKEAKAADLLMSMAELQKMLLQLTLDEKKDTLEGEHAALSAQHATDTQRIQELEAQNTELRRDACRVKTVTVPDPEHEKIRRKNDMLKSVLSLLITRSIENR